jgi:hypothetical protein
VACNSCKWTNVVTPGKLAKIQVSITGRKIIIINGLFNMHAPLQPYTRRENSVILKKSCEMKAGREPVTSRANVSL